MNEIVQMAFRSTTDLLRSEIVLMPLDRWNESVFRYQFCRFLAVAYPEVEQYVESGRIDLVLRRPPLIAFIEFKFYWRPRRFDVHDGKPCGFKGGPSQKNLSEFQVCIDHLHERPSTSHLSKYIVLVYADPVDNRRSKCRFSDYYDDYRHPRDSVSLCRIECNGPIKTPEAIIRAHLYEVA